jgi:hypothetical protein
VTLISLLVQIISKDRKICGTNKRTKIFLSVTSIIIAELERQLRTTTLSLIQAAAVYSNAFHS